MVGGRGGKQPPGGEVPPHSPWMPHVNQLEPYHLLQHKFHQVFDTLFRIFLCGVLIGGGRGQGEVGGVEGRWEELKGGGRSRREVGGAEGRWKETEMSSIIVAECLYRENCIRTLIMVFLSKWNISSRVTSPVLFKSYILKQTTAGERGRREARKRVTLLTDQTHYQLRKLF